MRWDNEEMGESRLWQPVIELSRDGKQEAGIRQWSHFCRTI